MEAQVPRKSNPRKDEPAGDVKRFVNRIIVGDCMEVLADMPEGSVDLVFADPPYNLQLRQDLWRPNRTLVDAVREEWDRFESFEEYDRFTRQWLSACRRVLKPDGALWVIGTYHNIFRIGTALQDLGFWILNDVIWVKTNPMPNFRGVRLTNATETLIWAARSERSRHTFNYRLARSLNGGKQLRNDWNLPICSGAERIRVQGRKLHPTQKPEALLERILAISTRPGDLVLDPFAGSGTTCVVAKRMGRRWIGIERDPVYAGAAEKRIADAEPEELSSEDTEPQARRVSFAMLVEEGMIVPGQSVLFDRNPALRAKVRRDGQLVMDDGRRGTIHVLGRMLSGGAPCNGWMHWYFQDPTGVLLPIDYLRQAWLAEHPADDAAG